ncbi:MAG TPA: glycerate-2-kinase family protein, partial [Herpetosiphonaceae bacterium]
MNPDRLLTRSLRDHPRGNALAEIMAAALASVDPAQSVRRHLRREGSAVVVGERRYELGADGRVLVVGGGKAGAPMAEAAHAALGDAITAGLVVVKTGHLGDSGVHIGSIALCEASHPVPDQRGADAAEQMIRLLDDVREQDLVLVLVSGGASALMTLPAPGLALADVQGLTNALLRCGASIGEINTLRKHCSRISGGQLALHAAPAQVAALIVSDVVGSPLEVIASGPTVPDPTTYAQAWALVERYNLEPEVPPAIAAHLRRGLAGKLPETPKADAPIWRRVQNQVIASNATAAEAAVAAAR